MTFIVLLAGALMLIAFPGHSPSYPGTSALLSGSAIEGLDCEPSPGAPQDPLTVPKHTRTAAFGLEGSYVCQRPVFTEGERNPFVERLLAGETHEAQRAAAALRAESASGPIAIKVTRLEDGALLNAVAAVYRIELTTALGAGRVVEAASSGATLWVELHASDLANHMSTLHWHGDHDVDAEGAALWRTL